jgi:hypothetical protein
MSTRSKKFTATKRSSTNKRSATKRSATNKRSAAIKRSATTKRSATSKRSATTKRSATSKRSATKKRSVGEKLSPSKIQRIEFDKYKWNIEDAEIWMEKNYRNYIDFTENNRKYIFIITPYKTSKNYKTLPFGTNTGIKTILSIN